MNTFLTIVVLVFVLVWAFRVEVGINEIRKMTERIEAELTTKKEKN